jgi:ELP3 family radical SAM enzyme/protein acetyltransferase
MSTATATASPIDIEDTLKSPFIHNVPICKVMLKDILKMDTGAFDTNESINATLRKLAKKYKYQTSKREIGLVYRNLIRSNPIEWPQNDTLLTTLINKSVRSASGIVNVSVSLPPDKFSCKYNCHFCPNEPGMPRSYLSNEDVFKRAAEVSFDTVKQVYNRLDVLEKNGHPIDKLEFRVLGGTFSCYDHSVTDKFVRDLYYAANTYYDLSEGERERGTIEEEQTINVTAKVHVVGLGIETRPDEINLDEIVRLRRYGVTRVELGVQHTDDSLLRKVNRGHGVKQSKRAIKLLKDYGFKVEIHIMTDLPDATPEGDMECYRQVLLGEDLIPDYMKDYPCLDVDFTRLKEWKAEGKWTPYSEANGAADLKRVLIYRQKITPPWVRVNRIQRDFKEAKEGVLGFTSEAIKTNLAQIVKDEAEKEGIYCQCIRCCEVSSETFNTEDIQYNIHQFIASGAQEYFISAIIPREPRPLLLGFLRLRLSAALEQSVIPEIRGRVAMIREVHTFGRVKQVGSDVTSGTQHIGIGKQLLTIAENIAVNKGFKEIAVISGIGVRDYYKKRGYGLNGTYMTKELCKGEDDFVFVLCLFIIYAIISYYNNTTMTK